MLECLILMKNWLILTCLTLYFGVANAQKQKVEIEKFKYKLSLKVADRESLETLDGTYVRLYNLDKRRVADSAVVENGYATFYLDRGTNYELMSARKGYLTRRGGFDAACYLRDPNLVFCLQGVNIQNISTPQRDTQEIEATMYMQKMQVDVSFKIENIYYDLNKWFIRPDAAKELDKLATILKDNPQIVVELGSHTDCRASNEYNLNLSQKRAESAVEYIITKGKIPSSRITAKGYGETKLINRCADGVQCSEDEHQQNRRTEVRITGILPDGQVIDKSGGQ